MFPPYPYLNMEKVHRRANIFFRGGGGVFYYVVVHSDSETLVSVGVKEVIHFLERMKHVIKPEWNPMILVGDILLKWGKLENDIRLMFKKMKMFKEKKI